MKTRTATQQDLPFLEQMLFEAFFWNPSHARPELQEFVQHPEFRKLLAGWERAGDKAVIAEENETPIGAAWYRFQQVKGAMTKKCAFEEIAEKQAGEITYRSYGARGVFKITVL